MTFKEFSEKYVDYVYLGFLPYASLGLIGLWVLYFGIGG